ncbi:hypothetical protein SAMN05421774_103217 [Gemmobacter megaterium]|uniref:Probable membrane transporter protein n=1 Tax=Gemmobacter megaterium TaxID=1086013 RepID=A0A1N7N9F7_9RHOB|nr:sulfite exporter TauE/SafE family protein [Gemmobacter megaterium]GGE13744.1 membrane protein [Gemmobacter megaterium]SIS94946.1 hypothetical protein SAMN05421774_103217 [Gemmobacter megaterium]
MLVAALTGWTGVPALHIGALLVTALVAGCARGLSGFGAGLIFIPLASMLIGPQMSVALLLITDLIGGLPTLRPAWREAERRSVLIMLGGALVGMPLGFAALLVLDPVLVRWCISVIVLALLALLVSGWRWRGDAGPPVLAAAGGCGGILSGLAQIGGPPVVAFWLGMPRPVAVLRANIMLYFGLSSVASLMLYGFGGLITPAVLAVSVVVTPAYMLGVILGIRLFRVASPQVFRRLSMVLIGLAAIIGMPLEWPPLPW